MKHPVYKYFKYEAKCPYSYEKEQTKYIWWKEEELFDVLLKDSGDEFLANIKEYYDGALKDGSFRGE